MVDGACGSDLSLSEKALALTPEDGVRFSETGALSESLDRRLGIHCPYLGRTPWEPMADPTVA